MAADQKPRPDAGSGDGGSDRQPKIVVDDPEDFAKTRQLRAIFDARDEYIQARRNANRAKEDREITYIQRNKRLFRYMQDFAITIEPLLKQYDAGREIWNETEYSIDLTVTTAGEIPSVHDSIQYCRQIIESADQIKQAAEQTGYADNAGDTFAGDIAKAHELLNKLPAEGEDFDGTHPAFVRRRIGGPVTNPTVDDLKDSIKEEFRTFATSWGWSVTGLKSLVKRTPKLEFPTNQTNEFKTTAPPQRVSDAAVRDMQDFMREIGLGVQFDETQQTKIDDDLLDEVDQWRQKNVN
jgi:hypothetical protein